MTSEAHWHEYRLPRKGELALVFSDTMIPFGIGLAAALALTFAFGLPAEQGFLATFLSDAGVDPRTISTTVDGIDLLSRVGVGVLFGLAYLVTFGACLAMLVTDNSTAKALVQAAAAGAPRSEVPAPYQVERVTRLGFQPLDLFLLISSLVSAIILVPLFFYAIVEEFWEGLIVSLVGLAIIALMIVWFRHNRRVGRPRQLRRRIQIAEHWTTRDEAAAWTTARENGEAHGSGKGHSDRHRLIHVGRLLDRIGFSGLAFVPVLFYALTFMLYPDAKRRSPSNWDLGSRTDLTGLSAQVATSAMWVFSALLILTIVLPTVGLLLQGRGESAERAQLAKDLDDVWAPRPPRGVLIHHSAQHASPFATFLAGIAGVGLAFGPAATLLSSMESEGFYSQADEIFAPHRVTALAVTALSIVLLIAAFSMNASAHVSGIELRNRLMHRWPTLPQPKERREGEETNVVAASVGPALTPTRNPENNEL